MVKKCARNMTFPITGNFILIHQYATGNFTLLSLGNHAAAISCGELNGNLLE